MGKKNLKKLFIIFIFFVSLLLPTDINKADNNPAGGVSFNKDPLQAIANIGDIESAGQEYISGNEETAKSYLNNIYSTANIIEVANEKQFITALSVSGNVLIKVMQSFDISPLTPAATIQNNTIVSIVGVTGNETITIHNRNEKPVITTNNTSNILINIDQLTIQGSLGPGQALTPTTTAPDLNEFILIQGGNNIAINTFSRFSFKNILGTGQSNFASLGGPNQIINILGSTFENNKSLNHNGIIGSRSFDSAINLYGIKMIDNMSDNVLINMPDNGPAYLNIFAGTFTGNLTMTWENARGINKTPKQALSDKIALTVYANKVESTNNWTIDDQYLKIEPNNINLAPIQTIMQSTNEQQILNIVNDYVVVNPQPGARLNVGTCWWDKTGDDFDEIYKKWLKTNLPGWKGIPIAVIRYENPALATKYKDQTHVDGIRSDYSTQVKHKGNNWLTTSGKYTLQKQTVYGTDYMVLVRNTKNYKVVIISFILILLAITVGSYLILKYTRERRARRNNQ